MIVEINNRPKRWVRSQNGWVAGVFQGIGERNDWEPNLLRVIWLISVFLFGTGIFFYLILALVLPREDRLDEYYETKILGVCYRISRNYGLELGMVRVLALASLLLSFGLTFFIYLLLWLILPEDRRHIYL